MSNPITITTAAADAFQKLLAEQADENLKLRIQIGGSPCSGMRVHFTLDERQLEEDFAAEAITSDETKLPVLLDPTAFQFLLGAEIDFSTENTAEGSFVLRNLQPMSGGCGSCSGCGSSQPAGDCCGNE